MKKLLLVLVFAILGITTTFGQGAGSTASASTSATVITPISIDKIIDLNFGTLAVDATQGGTVVMAPTSANSRSLTGGITLPNVTGTVTAAKFTVKGEGSSTYAITLPGDITLTGQNTAKTMTVGKFTSTPSSTGQLNSGTQDIFVGATLTVVAAQAADVYTNASDLKVTVNYN